MSATYAQHGVRGWFCFVLMCLAWSFESRAVQQYAEAIELDLRIAAQPLAEALQEFSRQSGMQVIFFSNLTKGVQSPGVTGRYTAAAALEKLLAGSGLSFRVINARAVEIYEPDAAQPRSSDGGE